MGPPRRLGDVQRRADQKGALLPHRDVGQTLRGDQEHLLRRVRGDVGRQTPATKQPPDDAPMLPEHPVEPTVIAGERRRPVHGGRYCSVSKHQCACLVMCGGSRIDH